MKRGVALPKDRAGFTIVETMIVLAVTGVLFVAVVGTWSGRQHRNEFFTAAQDIRSRTQQVVTDVQNGYFPNSAGFSCAKSGSGIVLTSAAATNKAQGTNEGCVFLGKVIQFGIKNSRDEDYRVMSVAGLATGTDTSTTMPTVVTPDGTGTTSGLSGDLSEESRLWYGLTAVKMVDDNGNGLNAVGFLSSMDDNANGAQDVQLYGIKGNLQLYSSLPADERNAAQAINVALKGASPVNAVKVCFQSGGTNQYALISLGDDGGKLASTLTIMNINDKTHPCGL